MRRHRADDISSHHFFSFSFLRSGRRAASREGTKSGAKRFSNVFAAVFSSTSFIFLRSGRRLASREGTKMGANDCSKARAGGNDRGVIQIGGLRLRGSTDGADAAVRSTKSRVQCQLHYSANALPLAKPQIPNSRKFTREFQFALKKIMQYA